MCVSCAVLSGVLMTKATVLISKGLTNTDQGVFPKNNEHLVNGLVILSSATPIWSGSEGAVQIWKFLWLSVARAISPCPKGRGPVPSPSGSPAFWNTKFSTYTMGSLGSLGSKPVPQVTVGRLLTVFVRFVRSVTTTLTWLCREFGSMIFNIPSALSLASTARPVVVLTVLVTLEIC